MNIYTKLFLLAIFLIVAVYIYACETHEDFFIPQNIVSNGDFHIEQTGSIADEGNFENDMNYYINGHGQI